MKAAYEFVAKGLKYAIEQHEKQNSGTDVASLDKDSAMPHCKVVAKDLANSVFIGVMRCSNMILEKPIAALTSGKIKPNPYAAFICVAQQGDLLETILSESMIWCIGEFNTWRSENDHALPVPIGGEVYDIH